MSDFTRGWFYSPETDRVGDVTSPTSVDSGVVKATPEQGKIDAPQKNYEAELQKREADLNRMKSTFQRQINDLNRKYEEEKRQYEDQLRKLKVSGLSDDERKEYETTLQIEDANRYKKEAEQYRMQVEEIQVAQSYAQFFTELGVPAASLVRDGGVDTLVQSGWEGVKKVIEELKKEINTLKNPPGSESSPKEEGQRGRQPMTSTPGTPYTGTTWDDLIKKYGSEEAVYNKVERGELSPSVIPLR